MRSVVTGYISARQCPVNRCSAARDAFLCDQPVWLRAPPPADTAQASAAQGQLSSPALHCSIPCPTCRAPLLHVFHLGTPLPHLRRALHFFGCANVACANGASAANGQLRSLVVFREQVPSCQHFHVLLLLLLLLLTQSVAGVGASAGIAPCCCCCCCCSARSR